MELRIFCQKSDCDKMLSLDVKFGYGERDILYIHGWIKRDGLIICRDCQRLEREREDIQQQKTA